jgi:ribose transport system ATP-binding protein
MVGRELKQVFPPKSVPGAEVLLQIVERASRPFIVSGANGSDARSTGLAIRRGEILGLAGLTGAGRTEWAETIYGLRGGGSPQQAVRDGIAYLSEDRQGAGILRDFNVMENVTLTSWRRYGRVFTHRRRERERAAHYAAAFRLRTPSLDTRLEFLSGGNQQKVALAKALDPQPDVLFCDEPTRGIDIQARAEIYEFLHKLVADGVGCVVISSDLEELLGLCNRIAVMRGGRIAGVVEGDRMNEQEIMLLATGTKA